VEEEEGRAEEREGREGEEKLLEDCLRVRNERKNVL
jgi:hypothetical protein